MCVYLSLFQISICSVSGAMTVAGICLGLVSFVLNMTHNWKCWSDTGLHAFDDEADIVTPITPEYLFSGATVGMSYAENLPIREADG